MSDAQLAWRLSCLTVHEIQQFYLSDIPLVRQTKSPTQIFPDNPQIESFHFICQTFLLSLWSCKQDVLCFGYCKKRVQIRSFFWSVFSRISTEYGEIRTRKNSLFGPFLRSDQLGFLEKTLLQRIFFWYFWDIYLFIYLLSFFLTLFNAIDIFIKYKLKI